MRTVAAVKTGDPYAVIAAQVDAAAEASGGAVARWRGGAVAAAAIR